MKKNFMLLFTIFLLILGPSSVKAMSLNLSLSCSNVIVGQTTTCRLRGSANGGSVTGIQANLAITGGASIDRVTAASNWDIYTNTVTNIYYTAGDQTLTGNFDIATLMIRGISAGNVTLKVTGIQYWDTAYYTLSSANIQTTFTVNAPATNPPATQSQSPTNTPTQAPTRNTTATRTLAPPTTAAPVTTTEYMLSTVPTTEPITLAPPTTKPAYNYVPDLTDLAGLNKKLITLYNTDKIEFIRQIFQTNDPNFTGLLLESLKVDDFAITYERGKYYVTVDPETELVNISATADEKLTVTGLGERELAVGKNVVDLVLTNEINQSLVVQVIITRPDDLKDYKTYLTSLSVADYPFAFSKDKLEYTINVPAELNNIYIEATTDNIDFTIIGDGKHELQKGNNDIYIKVQYGNKAVTTYVIHVKRTYATLILYITIASLALALIVAILYISFRRKKKEIIKQDAKNKKVADINRAAVEAQDNVLINGEKVITPANANVNPIKPLTNSTETLSEVSLVPKVQKQEEVVEEPLQDVEVLETLAPTLNEPVVKDEPKVNIVQLERQPIKINRQVVKTINTNKNINPNNQDNLNNPPNTR